MDKCQCIEILQKESLRPITRLILHLTGCPESYTTKEYNLLPWWKKLFAFNPRKIYQMHKNDTGTF